MKLAQAWKKKFNFRQGRRAQQPQRRRSCRNRAQAVAEAENGRLSFLSGLAAQNVDLELGPHVAIPSESTQSNEPSTAEKTAVVNLVSDSDLPVPFQSELVPVVEPVESVPEPIPLFEPEIEEDGFRLNDFIRPGQKLKSSLEGFMLDQRSDHTRRAYGKDITRFVKFLIVRREQKGNELLDRSVIIGYKDWLQGDGLQSSTIDRHLATLKSVFKWLTEEGIFDRSPAENVRFIKAKKFSKTVGFTDKEVANILKLPNLHKRVGAQHYAILMLLFYCGLRRSELCSIKCNQISKEEVKEKKRDPAKETSSDPIRQRSIYILRLSGKGNKERIIPLTVDVWKAIKHYMRMTGKRLTRDEYLFTPQRNNRTGVTNKPLDATSIYYVVTKYAREAGVVNKVSPHSCRATAISNARDQQVSDRVIQEFAGWSSTEMITRYDKRKTAITDSAAHVIDYGNQSQHIPHWPDEWWKGESPDLTAQT